MGDAIAAQLTCLSSVPGPDALFLELDLDFEPERLCLLWEWVLEWSRGRPRCGSRSALEVRSSAWRFTNSRRFSRNGSLKRFGQPLAAVRWDPPQRVQWG